MKSDSKYCIVSNNWLRVFNPSLELTLPSSTPPSTSLLLLLPPLSPPPPPPPQGTYGLKGTKGLPPQ
ncbi:hypothetical protein E2C01_096916 [Portunus trituberculatus]|uniref:Uncharacterized protein n=1 Tax=Portunus trituberculatus TaxID=210409 RepID=A0A5B7JWW6_PORTR|nr:hypothetical protein [Portunus trituberculatus]